MITGGNTGIGYEAALALTRDHGYAVTLACRDAVKADAAAGKIRAAVPGASVETLSLDLSDLASVSDAAKRLLDSGREVDVLLNNAGVMACPYMQTKQGYEYQWGVNHLGHFLLTESLLPSLRARAAAGGDVRVVGVASAAHAFGQIDFDSFQSGRVGGKDYSPWPAYGQSKLANVMHAYELSRRLAADAAAPAVPAVNALHPGVVRTELGRFLIPDDAPFYVKAAWALMYPFTLSPPDGAKTSIHLCSSPDVRGISGKYWDKCKPVSSQPQSYDVEVARRLYDRSSELVASYLPSGAAATVA